MQLLGVEKVSDLGPEYVSFSIHITSRMSMVADNLQINSRIVEQQIYDGPSGLAKALRARL
jgi:hypothetical protein